MPEARYDTMENVSQSFSPIIGDTPRVLILGTLPSKVSLERQQYYGHPQNKFWRIIYALFEGDYQEDYKKKVDFAKEQQIAIWDVCYTAVRPGSLDAHISAEKPNCIDEILQELPSISLIAFNGKKSEQLFFKYFKKTEGISYVTLLSSSPANAAYSFVQKLDDWKKIIVA